MTEDGQKEASSGVRLRRGWVVTIVISVVLIGAAITGVFLWRGGGSSTGGRPVPAPSFEQVPPSKGASKLPGDREITLSPVELQNAGIRVEAARAGADSTPQTGLRTTGVVQANAYREVAVFPIAGGIVREVRFELGDRVKPGQTLAVIFSNDLADAQAEYLKMEAELEEHHLHYRRVAELVEIGAVSKEELEQVTTMHRTAEAKLAFIRQRLLLLGMTGQLIDALESPDQLQALVSVPAPSAGTVIGRSLNTGEVVPVGKEIGRIADLSNVWVIGQVYERDFQAVRLGTPAAITTPAYPDRSFSGRVSYIDPMVDAATRTAQVRVELANPREVLRFGMFVDIVFGDSAGERRPLALVPQGAIQSIGERQVVYLPGDQAGSFIQREVEAGPPADGFVPVYSGIVGGDQVVTEGSFLLRAQSVKLDPAQLNLPKSPPSDRVQSAPAEKGEARPGLQAFTVRLTGDGYAPERITLKKGILTRLTFIREVEVTCGTDLEIPEYGIKKDLPLNQPTVVEFTPARTGEFQFACGMGMLRGKIIVR